VVSAKAVRFHWGSKSGGADGEKKEKSAEGIKHDDGILPDAPTRRATDLSTNGGEYRVT